MTWLVAAQWLWIIGMVAGTTVDFPNPQKEFRLCGRKNASFVCDPEFVLDIGDVDRLDHLAQEFRKSTTCICSPCNTGVSIGIFIRRSLTQEVAKLYPDGKGMAEMLRKRWHLGKCNDDIVIILLTDMNISDYSMGSSVQGILPDKTARLILTDCNIHFLSGCYYQGLESVVSSFNDVLVKLQKQKKSLSKSLIVGISLGIGVLLILLLLAVILLRRQSNRRKQGCKNIYESVPTKSNHENFVNDKIHEYQLEKLHQQSCSENEDDYMGDEDANVNTLSRQFLQIKRQLSDVVEESDDGETIKERENFSFDTLPYSPQGTNRSLQVTEL